MKKSIFSIKKIVMLSSIMASVFINSQAVYALSGSHNDGPQLCQGLAGSAQMAGMVGAFTPFPWVAFASDAASYAAGIGLSECKAEFNAPATKNILPDSSNGSGSCQKTITQKNRMIYSNTFGAAHYNSTGRFDELGKPSIYYFNSGADINLRQVKNESGVFSLKDRTPGSLDYDEKETFELAVGKNTLEYRATSTLSPYTLTPFFMAGLPSSSPVKKSAVKNNRFLQNFITKKFTTFVKRKASAGVPSAILSEMAGKHYFDGYRLSEYGGILPDVYNKDTQEVWVRDDIKPSLSTRIDPENFELKISEVISYDSANNRFVLEAIHPGGINSSSGFGLLNPLLEYADECGRAVSLSSSHDNSGDFWNIDDQFKVSWTARDPVSSSSGHRNATTISYNVEIKDTKPPILLAPPGKVIIASDNTGPIFVGEPSVFDLADLNVSVVGTGLDASGRRSFPQGLTTITWTATDSSGNSVTAEQHIVVKPAGSNTKPVADGQTVDTKTYQQTEIILRGADADIHSGVNEPISFDLVSQPNDGFFVAPLAPYFIEDFRLEASAAKFIGNQKQNDPEEYCSLDVGPSDTVWHMEYPFDNENRDMWMSVDDAGNSYILDYGAVFCDYSGDLKTHLRLAKIDNQGNFVKGYDLDSELGESVPRALFWDNLTNNIYLTYEIDPGQSIIKVLNGDLVETASYDMSKDGNNSDVYIQQPITAIAAFNNTIYLYQEGYDFVYAFKQDESLNYRVLFEKKFALIDSSVVSLDVDNDGNLYTANSDHRIYKYDAASTSFIGWMGKCKNSIGGGSAFNCNDDTQPDEEKRHSYGFSCTDTTCASPSVLAGKYSGQFTNDDNKKIDMSFSPSNILYIAETKTNRVQRFTVDGFPAGEAKTTGAGYGFILGDFNAITYIEVNQTKFYLLDQDSNLLHIFKTTPLTPVDTDNNGIIDGARLVYQSNTDFPNIGSILGTDSFTFRVNDGLDYSTEATVLIDVSRNYRAPELQTNMLTLVVDEDSNTDATFNVRDSDVQDVSLLSGILVQPPTHGTVSFNGKQLTYTPEPDFFGEDSFSFSGFDSSEPPIEFAGQDTSPEVASVVVTVKPVADSPRLTGAEPTEEALLGFRKLYEFNYFNPDGVAGIDSVTASIEWGDGEVSHSGEVLYNGASITELIATGVEFDFNINSVIAKYPDPYPVNPALAGQEKEVTNITQTGPALVLDGNGKGSITAEHLYTSQGSKDIRFCIQQMIKGTVKETCESAVTDVTVVPKPSLSIEVEAVSNGVLKTEGNKFNVTVMNAPFDLLPSDPRYSELPSSGSSASGIVIEAGSNDSLTILDSLSNKVACQLNGGVVSCDDISLTYGSSFVFSVDVENAPAVIEGSFQQLAVTASSSENEQDYLNMGEFEVLADSDNDGLSDKYEISIGTNPNKPDTDDDGVNDKLDVFPLDKTESVDTDGDGIGNNKDTDDDNDGVTDSADAFPLDAAESVDTDGDGIGNNSDPDDDNDGIIDEDDSEPLNAEVGDKQAPVISDVQALTFEATGELTEISLTAPEVTDNNLNAPTITFDLAEALMLGDHVITWTATDFVGNQTTKEQFVTIIDTTAPEFDEITVLTLNAKGRLTNIATDVNISAFDLVDGDVSASIVGSNKLLSGRHDINLKVSDNSGNVATAKLTLDILPEMSVVSEMNVEAGGSYQFTVSLSGQAPSYPVDINYQLTNNGQVIMNTAVAIDEGTQGLLSIEVPVDVVATDNLSVSLVSRSSNTFIGNNNQSQLIVIDYNVAPQLDLQISQNGGVVSVIGPDNGLVTIAATIKDLNQNDSHEISWTVLDNAFTYVTSDNNELSVEVDPSMLDEGAYRFNIIAVEKNTEEALSVSRTVQFIVEQLAELATDTDSDGDGIIDSDEGYSDGDGDGIVDYLDNDSNTTRLPSSANAEPMHTSPGLTMSLGLLVQKSQGSSGAFASMTMDDLVQVVGEGAADTQDNHFLVVSPLYNFIIDGLTEAGDSVAVIIPLETETSLAEGAVYRKYNTVDGWYTFVENENNSVSSASTDENGNCPSLYNASYNLGLTAGDNCIQLIIEDGGVNDIDFIINASIEDPGVIAIEQKNQSPMINLAANYEVNEETAVLLDASNTTDSEGDELTYLWQQTSGTAVELSETTDAQLSFTSPSLSQDGVLTFELTVNDGMDSSSMSIQVMVYHINKSPIVTINDHQHSYVEGSIVTLTMQTSDPDEDALTYIWEQISGPSIVFDNASAAQVSFILPDVTNEKTIKVQVEVTDGALSVTSVTSLSVTPKAKLEKESSGGVMSWVLLFILGIKVGKRVLLTNAA